MTSGEVTSQIKPLYELEAGQVFLNSVTQGFLVLLSDRKNCKGLLGYDPPSLPVAEVERNGIGYRIKESKPLSLGGTVPVVADSGCIGDTAKYFSSIQDAYVRFFTRSE